MDIEDLMVELKTYEWKIVKEENDYFLTSENMDQMADPEEVLSNASALLDLLNGAANIAHYNHRTVGIASLHIMDSWGNRTVFIFPDPIKGRSRARALLNDQGSDSKYSPTRTEEWLQKAAQNENARDAIHFFNQKSWWGLYKVYEVICTDVKGEKNLFRLFPQLKNKLENFRQTAQSREAIGDEARHGRKFSSPKHPLTLKQAHELIKNLFEAWIQQI